MENENSREKAKVFQSDRQIDVQTLFRYTRADGIAMLVLRRSDITCTPRWSVREPYAQVINIGTNNDGHTKEGITFPSADAQGELARQVCHSLL